MSDWSKRFFNIKHQSYCVFLYLNERKCLITLFNEYCQFCQSAIEGQRKRRFALKAHRPPRDIFYGVGEHNRSGVAKAGSQKTNTERQMFRNWKLFKFDLR